MAHPLVFPGKYFFYPIGNTSAVSLLKDLAPEEPANILLLGCGDPRNVLYSIFCEPQTPAFSRPLDFTCCDIDPAISARNVILFTLLADSRLSTDVIWNTFFHFYLDKDSLAQLTEHCKKLLKIGESLKEWSSSKYARFIRIGTQYTLTELRRHWRLYTELHSLSPDRKNRIRDAFSATAKSTKGLSVASAARSAGPLVGKASKVCAELFVAYWKTGTTSSRTHEITAATFLNPTFVYSLGGEGFNVHYGTDPITPFHLAALFGNAQGARPVSGYDVIRTVKAQFDDWCSAFRTIISSTRRATIIRVFACEATALCRALKGFSTAGALNLGIPVAQWKTQLIQLNPVEYGNAPSTFNVIDTSNLSDHIGLLNTLIATVPLLRSPSRGSILYTESLLSYGIDATKEFAERLQADVHTLGLLLGVTPIDYLSGFSSRSNTHELMMNSWGLKSQFHQMTTWKSPVSGDQLVSTCHKPLPAVWDGRQLGTLLYDIYHELFEQEDARHFWRINQNNLSNALSASNIVHYMRESFVLFLKLVRENLEIPAELWIEVMDRFIALKEADQSLPMDSVNYQDLAGHLYLHGMHTLPFLHITKKSGPFSSWGTVPLLVRVILVVPREKFNVLHILGGTLGTPVLQCDARGNWSHNIFTGVHAAFGTVIRLGTKSHPRVTFKEDPEGWEGSSPVVVSFTMSAGLLTLEPAAHTRICLSVRTTPASAMVVVQRLGLEQSVFGANIMDEDHVHIVPQDPFPAPPRDSTSRSSYHSFEIGNVDPVAVELDEECELVSRLTSVVQVQNNEAKALFGSGVMPTISQVSPCVMRLVVGGHAQNVVYPIPVIGSQNMLRLARKSSYIEVIVPPSGPFKHDGMKLNPFPVSGMDTKLQPWNMHRLNLTSLPILNLKTSDQKKWLNMHLGSMMSTREYALRKAHEDDAMMRVKDTLNSIFVQSTGAQGGAVKRVFNLIDKETNNCDTILFISELRFDLASHTVVCDGYVLPLTRKMLPKIETPLGKLEQEKLIRTIPMSKVEINAWKRLLPALAERCRLWKHGDNCEYLMQGKIPLSDEMEQDPLCGCGKGKDVEPMSKVAAWAKFAPFAVRVALSPLFAVSYLEKIGRDPAAGRCFVCRGKGKPKMMKCTACAKVRYCSKECQRKDWKAHKPRCKQAVMKA
ncbi:hypothetical protein B0H15DRAFT_911711 [Mycena belliarum]|uniref:MYND-type domain-containing protein n=1 Tax=Mycena belliarum TaxID=1033014 RepID=A0AAD6XS80_9AGAR|nr:hypothetical protein B0H15DRAFT_911711 [Mycena belliae]